MTAQSEDVPIGELPVVRPEIAQPFNPGWLGASSKRVSRYGYMHCDAVTRNGSKGMACIGLKCNGSVTFIEAGEKSRLLINGELPLARFSTDDRWLVGAATGESPSDVPNPATATFWLGVWDADSGKPLFRLKLDDGVREFAFSPDGSKMAIVGSKRVYVWNDFGTRAVTAGKQE